LAICKKSSRRTAGGYGSKANSATAAAFSFPYRRNAGRKLKLYRHEAVLLARSFFFFKAQNFQRLNQP
jgi:hypothetical protein